MSRINLESNRLNLKVSQESKALANELKKRRRTSLGGLFEVLVEEEAQREQERRVERPMRVPPIGNTSLGQAAAPRRKTGAKHSRHKRGQPKDDRR